MRVSEGVDQATAATRDVASTEETAEVRRGRPRNPAVDAAVLDAAMDLLGEVGYARLTMRDVATRAQVSKASVYLRWPNKVALVTDALGHRAQAVPDLPDTGSLARDMRAFLRDLVRSRNSASRALSAVSGEIASHPELRHAWNQGLAGSLSNSLRSIVNRAVQRGELPESTDVELLSALPLALFQHWRQTHHSDPDDEVINRIVTQFYRPTVG
jgi:AcrR family transcriptional regulator